jgi:colicin import membrane protein
MKLTAADRWRPIALASALHALLAGLFLWGYWQFHRPKPPQPQVLAIEATVVDSRRLSVGPPPAAEAPPVEEVAPPAVAEPPPAPKPEKKAEKHVEKKSEPKPEPKPEKKPSKAEVREKKKAEAKREAEEKAEKAKAEKAKQDAERKAREDAEKQAREKAAADRQTAQRQAELRARMAAEERFTSAQAAGLLAQYQAQIQARIERAWIRPASAKPGLNCEVRITQVAGGEVVGVQVGRCNGDESVRQSIETAAYRASPLPQPPDPSLFDRNLVVTFRPQD